jgi:Tol biopolymer transport system component
MKVIFSLPAFAFSLLAVCSSGLAEPEIQRIGLPGQIASLGYYNTTPESPDGTRIAYVIQDGVSKAYINGGRTTGSLWICSRDLTGHRKVRDISSIGAHNGANVLWIDDSRIAYSDDGRIYIIDVDSGAVLHGPYEGGLGHNTVENHILLSAGKDNPYGPSGIYEINADTGEIQLIRSDVSHAAYQSEFPDGYNPDETTWKTLHLQYSPSGSRISYRFDAAHKSFVGNDRQEEFKLVYTMNRDGSEPVLFGPKPMHFSWFDDHSIAGHDNQIDDGLPDNKHARRWDRQGNFIETLAGYGNHLAFSPDRQFYATESWYGTVPVVLRVYRRGETAPLLQRVVSEDDNTTWDLRYHVNPSFSRDGRRVYFNNSPEAGIIEASYIEIGETPVAERQVLFADDFESWTVGQPVTDSGNDPQRWKSDGDPFDLIERDTGNAFGLGPDNRFMRLGNVSSGSLLAGGNLDIEQRNYDKGEGVTTGVLRVSFDLYEPSSGSGKGMLGDLSEPAFLRLRGDETGPSLHTIRIDDGKLQEDSEGGAVLYAFGENTAVRFDFIFNQSGADVTYRGRVLHPGEFDVYADNFLVAGNIRSGTSDSSDEIERIYFRTEYPEDGDSAQELWIDNWETDAVPDPVSERHWMNTGPRYGWTDNRMAPWYYSLEHGWLYFPFGDSLLFYHDQMDGSAVGWLLMPRETYPYGFSHRLGTWVQFSVSEERDASGWLPLTRSLVVGDDVFPIGE